MKKPFLYSAAVLLLSFACIQKTAAQNKNTRYQTIEGKDCDIEFREVQNRTFDLDDGTKTIIAYTITGFNDSDQCWDMIKEQGKIMTASSAIAAVYFFTLPANEISEIDSKYKDFSQYGKNLIGEYWKDPDSGEDLKRYPNEVMKEN